MDGRLKVPCPRPPPLIRTYSGLLAWAVDAEVNMECNERKIEDLSSSIEGRAP